jgi:cytochrome c oxidase subunit 2
MRRLLLLIALVLVLVGGVVAPVLAAGNPTAGKKVFGANGCGGCHTFKAAGSKGTVGPALTKTSLASHAKTTKQTLEAYIRTSIVKPNAYVVKTFPKNVMPGTYGKTIKTKSLDDLVAFIAKG